MKNQGGRAVIYLPTFVQVILFAVIGFLISLCTTSTAFVASVGKGGALVLTLMFAGLAGHILTTTGIGKYVPKWFIAVGTSLAVCLIASLFFLF